MLKGISEAKRKWMQSVGIREFPRQYKYYHQSDKGDRDIDMVYTEKYIKNTPLSILQERHQKFITRKERLAQKLAEEKERNSKCNT